tara:strand:+ start:562 stop:699 length:138 start_codon:yes stop_codon:yes gene_type:complete
MGKIEFFILFSFNFKVKLRKVFISSVDLVQSLLGKPIVPNECQDF